MRLAVPTTLCALALVGFGGASAAAAEPASVNDFNLDSIPPAGPGGCADCYADDLRYEGHHIELEEVDVPAPLRAVFDQIDAIIAAHAATPGARAARG